MKKWLGLLFLSILLLNCSQESIEMIKVKGSRFEMGNGRGRPEEKPLHWVTLDDFHISATEVTQALYDSIMGTNPSDFKGPQNPVENVSWNDAIKFCNALSIADGISPAYAFNGDRIIWDKNSSGYRLPTEAEWEYAARGGLEDKRSTFAGGDDIEKVAWHVGNSKKQTQPVATLEANELGIYDMSGNVMEWVWDWDNVYPDKAVANPRGPLKGQYKILRGGSWGVSGIGHRITYRATRMPDYKNNFIGFRVAQSDL